MANYPTPPRDSQDTGPTSRLLMPLSSARQRIATPPSSMSTPEFGNESADCSTSLQASQTTSNRGIPTATLPATKLPLEPSQGIVDYQRVLHTLALQVSLRRLQAMESQNQETGQKTSRTSYDPVYGTYSDVDPVWNGRCWADAVCPSQQSVISRAPDEEVHDIVESIEYDDPPRPKRRKKASTKSTRQSKT